ncbi:hypothetical protein QTP81_11810 [Alteromonas sp. ASW11-36]|uniref:Uncharacterized protein n=1 Tax=Alteromonas arenosi TaxID=3055817 RepID=A0ABT7SYL3_9ALTE|nr:hypothetical protein [Alteromonas sp. ASW11-36]MDM7861281.1 hypothetical protein [Alteromonas sp. ASW11-36]
MGSFDFFALALTCPDCGASYTENAPTNMQTKIQNHMYLAMLAVGTKLDIYYPITDCGYALVNPPVKKDSFTLIDAWECVNCSGYQWALITVEDSVLTGGQAVKLSCEIINNVNYLSDDANDIGWQIVSGKAVYEGSERL